MGKYKMGNYRVGDKVRLSPAGKENDCYASFAGKVLRITHVAANREQHPGFDEAAGSPLYDLEDLEGNQIPCSLYDWELL